MPAFRAERALPAQQRALRQRIACGSGGRDGVGISEIVGEEGRERDVGRLTQARADDLE